MWFCYIIIFWDCFFAGRGEKVSASYIVFSLQVSILFPCFGFIVDFFPPNIPNSLFSAQIEKEIERLIGISELTRWDLLIIGFTVEWLAGPIIWGITVTSFFRSFSWNVQILGKDYTPLLLASEGLGASVLEAKWGKWFVHQISLFSVNLSLKCVTHSAQRSCSIRSRIKTTLLEKDTPGLYLGRSRDGCPVIQKRTNDPGICILSWILTSFYQFFSTGTWYYNKSE